jgi:hypothetical protein
MSEKINHTEIVNEAFAAAAAATQAFHDKHGQVYPCGFAWVRIKPARGPFVAAIKERDSTGWYVENGLCVYNPSKHWTQSVDGKYAGAEAFAAVLQKHGVNCWAESRLD